MLQLHGRQLPLQLHCLIQTQLGLSQPTALSARCSRRSVLRTWVPCATSTATYATIASEDTEMEKERPPSKNPFPYPTHPNPTPHQIFHLASNATQAQIKARYYELVRTHHPDSRHAAGLSAKLAHARFRTIKASYDFLSGRTLSPDPNSRPASSPQNFDPYMHELARRRRAYYASQGRYRTDDEDPSWTKTGWSEGFGAPKGQRSEWNEDGWRERLILAFGVVTLLAGLFPTMPFTIASTFLPTSANIPPPSSPSRFASSSPSPNSGSTPNSSASGRSALSEASSPAGAPSSSSSFSLPFGLDLDKGHRAAVSALVQVRSEREEMGAERREGMKKRVREMTGDTNSPSPQGMQVASDQSEKADDACAPAEHVLANTAAQDAASPAQEGSKGAETPSTEMGQQPHSSLTSANVTAPESSLSSSATPPSL
ncbi:hypothetical protein BDZ97DRAFT_1824852 [Flammula alnicola]|nr:hypothetical protein BDZ97DRAFT_1824852 [Flammula alnicola]